MSRSQGRPPACADRAVEAYSSRRRPRTGGIALNATDDGRSSTLSEADAAALWRRAAELQADEVRRAEERSRQTALRRALAGEKAPDGSAFSIAEVEAAALDAGIPAEYVHLAWLERRFDKWAASEPTERSERARRRVLGTDQQSMEVSRRYALAPDRVLDAMGRVFPNAPFHLQLEAHEPMAGGRGSVLVFAVPGMSEWSNSGVYTSFVMNMHWIDLKKLFVTVRPAEDSKAEAPATEVSIRSPLAYSRRLNYGVGLGLGSALGLAGGVGGVFGGLALFAGAIAGGAALAPVAVGALGVVGFGAGRGLGDWGYRALYRLALKKGRTGLEDLLQALGLHAQTGGAFAPVSAPALETNAGPKE